MCVNRCTIGPYKLIIHETPAKCKPLIQNIFPGGQTGRLDKPVQSKYNENKNRQERAVNIDFKSIIAYRYLIYQLVLRDIKVRYKNSVLGFFWSLANPLIQVEV